MQDALHNKWQLQHLLASLGVLSLTRSAVSANFGLLFHFARNGTSVTLQNRSAVSANFGLIDMSKCAVSGRKWFQNVPVLAREHCLCLSGDGTRIGCSLTSVAALCC